MARLILVRHGKSEWNLKGLWTGWTDVSLAPVGQADARETARLIEDIQIDTVFTSKLKRAKETWEEMNKVLKRKVPVIESEALNERDYGDFTGKNKWEVEKEVGEEEFLKIRRSWDYPLPNGESLKQVSERVLPYFHEHVEPLLKAGKNVLISAHGNSLRALAKYLESISDDDISKVEFVPASAYIYELDYEGKVIKKEIFGKKENTV